MLVQYLAPEPQGGALALLRTAQEVKLGLINQSATALFTDFSLCRVY